MGMEDNFYQALEQHGITLKRFREDTRLQLVARKIVHREGEISDDEAREYFTVNQDAFNIPDQVKVRHILVDIEEEAREVLALLGQGEDLPSWPGSAQDPCSKDAGGNLGFFGPGEMLPDFEEAAFSLEVGERSGPVETWYGFHIIEVLDRQEGRIVTYEEVAEEVKEALVEEKAYSLLQNMFVKLRNEAVID